MTGLAEVDGFNIAIQDCMLPGFRLLEEYKRGGPFNILRLWK